ncbi:MAG: hypothetical protein ABJZ55_20635 [Fuerstiella sp.]
MLDTVLDLFSRRDPRREAVVGLARILNRRDVASLAFESGHEVDRRDNDQRKVSWGVWLFRIDAKTKAAELQLDCGLPAVTQDLRREGIGVMTPMQLAGDQFVIAMPEEPVLNTYAPERNSSETSWIFFRCDVRHNSRCPGGWFQLGLQVAESISLESDQRVQFREHIQSVIRDADV